MAEAKKRKEELKDEREMKENYEMLLRMGMVEMVYDLDLLGRRAGTKPKADDKKELQRSDRKAEAKQQGAEK